MFDSYWADFCNSSILDYENAKLLFGHIELCDTCVGATAEVGVYEGTTSKLIKHVLNKVHYCYDTFEGIVGSSLLHGDKHGNGEFVCHLDKVKQTITATMFFTK